MRNLLLALALAAPLTFAGPLVARQPEAHCATCIGADPCKACKNCKACQHCYVLGRKCGTCKPKGKP